jgi:uncharacterized protein (DUF2147 family)
MKQTLILKCAAAAALTLFPFAHAYAAPDATGVWINDTGRGAVEIQPCGKALCGHVVWVKDPNDTKGCGKQIIGDVESSGGGVWDGGWIYSPEKRRNYDVELKPLADGTLRVVGYMGTKLFSRTMIWTRAPSDLQRCSTIEAKADPAPAAVAAPTKDPVTAAKSEPEKTPPPAATTPAASPSPSTAAASPATPKSETASPDVAAKDTAPNAEAAPAPSADANNDDGGEKPGERKKGNGVDLSKLKIGDISLDKVLTKTKSGKCKLDLPWVKVQIDCE